MKTLIEHVPGLTEEILTQKRITKGKIYSLHAPEVECDRRKSPWDIAKGKAHKPYEFGVKVCLAVTYKKCFVVGIQAYPGNLFDAHTLDCQLDQMERITGKVPGTTFVDRGYKGHGVTEEKSRVFISGTRSGATTDYCSCPSRSGSCEPFWPSCSWDSFPPGGGRRLSPPGGTW